MWKPELKLLNNLLLKLERAMVRHRRLGEYMNHKNESADEKGFLFQ